MSYIKKETAINRLEGLVETAEKYDTPVCLNALRGALAELCDVPEEKDVVEVVRCEKCDHYHSKIKLCKLFQIYFTPDHFCAEGVSKGGAE